MISSSEWKMRFNSFSIQIRPIQPFRNFIKWNYRALPRSVRVEHQNLSVKSDKIGREIKKYSSLETTKWQRKKLMGLSMLRIWFECQYLVCEYSKCVLYIIYYSKHLTWSNRTEPNRIMKWMAYPMVWNDNDEAIPKNKKQVGKFIYW